MNKYDIKTYTLRKQNAGKYTGFEYDLCLISRNNTWSVQKYVCPFQPSLRDKGTYFQNGKSNTIISFTISGC